VASKIRKGDTVQVLAGKNKGSRGTVLRVDVPNRKVIVEGINVVKRHTKPSQQSGRGGIVEKESPIQISNVALIHDGKPTRVGFREVDGKKVRWSLKADEAIDA
jgi:large subunit ribosomal protein L24